MFLVMLTLILGLRVPFILNHLSGWAPSLILKWKEKLWKERSFIPAALWEGETETDFIKGDSAG